MGKDKLRRFRENETFACFLQPEFETVFRTDHPIKGHWARDFFHNDRPIVIELGCGKGEYTVALAERDPARNYIGIDIKGARMWRGAKTVTERQIANAGFLRTRIEFIDSLFAEGEVSEMDYLSRSAAQNATGRQTAHVARISDALCPSVGSRRADSSENRFATSLRLYAGGDRAFRVAVQRGESGYLRFRLCRRGIVCQDGLRKSFFGDGAADYVHLFFVGRTTRLSVVRVGE